MTNIRNTEWFSEYRSCIEQGDLQNAKKCYYATFLMMM